MLDLKIVLEQYGNSILIGVGKTDVDFLTKTHQGSLEGALAAVPDFVKECEEKWALSPKNPAYKAPAASKPATTPPAATTPAQKAEDLPLLSGTEKPAEEQAEKPVGGPISKEEAIKIAEEQGGSREELEAQPEAEAEITEPPAAPAEAEPEPVVSPVEPEAVEPAESGVEEGKTEQEISERIAQAPAPAVAEPAPSAAPKPGEWDYYLQDGRGPFESVQLAMDALGLDPNTRPSHNRWDRLSTALKVKIQSRPKP